MAYLRLIVNPDDDNAFLRIINTPRRQIGTSTLETLGRYATERAISLFAAVDEMGLQRQLPEKSLERLQRFVRWLEHITRQCESDQPMASIREMLADMDYQGWLHQNSSTPKAAERRWENVNYLVESLGKTLEKDEDDEATSIRDAIAKLVLRDLLERQEEEDLTDRVQLMTLHASKGLEFPHVFVMGLEEELLPHRSSIESDSIEEERRLMYVGITRARETLTLTIAAQRRQYGEKMETIPRRFLDELPEDDVRLEGTGDLDQEANQQKGKATLSSLLGDLCT
jgi:ATP-dependent DNA helicase Rep